MLDGSSLLVARCIELFFGCIFYGIHLVTLGNCLWYLLTTDAKLKRFSELNWPMILVALTFGGISTLHVVLGLYHLIQAFIFTDGPGGPAHVFTNISDWINVTRTVTVNMQTTLGDAMLIYRCWVVWSRTWQVVAIPIVLWVAGTTCSAIMFFLEATLHSNVLVNSNRIQPFASSFWALTIVVNIISTSLIVWRIWRVERNSSRYRTRDSLNRKRDSYLKRAMRGAIESGLMYTVVAFMTFVVYVTKSNALFTLTHVEMQVVGIAFDLIIIRVARHQKTAAANTIQPPSMPLHFATNQTGTNPMAFGAMTRNTTATFKSVSGETALTGETKTAVQRSSRASSERPEEESDTY